MIYIKNIVKAIITMMLQLQVYLCSLLQIYNKPTLKIDYDTDNNKLFGVIMPLLRDLLQSSSVILELKKFQSTFGSFSEDLQLLIISQMIIANVSIVNEPDEIRYVHYCLYDSNLLRAWQKKMHMMDRLWSSQNRYEHITNRIQISLYKLDQFFMGDLAIKLIQISKKAVLTEMKMVY